MISLGGVIGAGLFVGSSAAIKIAGPGVFLVYAACGVQVLLNMRMLGEMAAAQPRRGSFATYIALSLGPWAGFVVRWLYWYCQLFTIGAEAVIGAQLLSQLGAPGPIWVVGLGLMALLTVINLFSVRAYGELETWLASLKIVAIILFIGAGLAYIASSAAGVSGALTTMTDHGGLFPNGFYGAVAAIPIVIFSMFGSEMATIAAAESDDPAANIVKAGRNVALRVVLFYVASIVMIVSIVRWGALTVGTSPFATALDVMGIPWSGAVMSVVVLTAVVSCLNSGIYVSSRMLYELGRSGDGPRILTWTASNKTPMVGVLIACAVGAAATLGQLFVRQDVFTLLASSTGAIGLFIAALTAVAQIKQRRAFEAAGVALPVKVWLFPWLSYAVLAALAGVFVLIAAAPGQGPALLLSVLTLSIVFGALWLRKRMAVGDDGISRPDWGASPVPSAPID
jgi:L-asparagine transporter-like permease